MQDELEFTVKDNTHTHTKRDTSTCVLVYVCGRLLIHAERGVCTNVKLMKHAKKARVREAVKYLKNVRNACV